MDLSHIRDPLFGALLEVGPCSGGQSGPEVVSVFTWQTPDLLHLYSWGLTAGSANSKHLITVFQMHYPQPHSIWCLSLRETCEFLRVS